MVLGELDRRHLLRLSMRCVRVLVVLLLLSGTVARKRSTVDIVIVIAVAVALLSGVQGLSTT
jgi:hypothetical protein